MDKSPRAAATMRQQPLPSSSLNWEGQERQQRPQSRPDPGSECLKSDSILTESRLSNGKLKRTFKSAFVFLNMFELTGGMICRILPLRARGVKAQVCIPPEKKTYSREGTAQHPPRR